MNISLNPILLKRLTITGSTLRSRPIEFKHEVAMEMYNKVWPLIEAGKLKPIIHAVVRFELREWHIVAIGRSGQGSYHDGEEWTDWKDCSYHGVKARYRNDKVIPFMFLLFDYYSTVYWQRGCRETWICVFLFNNLFHNEWSNIQDSKTKNSNTLQEKIKVLITATMHIILCNNNTIHRGSHIIVKVKPSLFCGSYKEIMNSLLQREVLESEILVVFLNEHPPIDITLRLGRSINHISSWYYPNSNLSFQRMLDLLFWMSVALEGQMDQLWVVILDRVNAFEPVMNVVSWGRSYKSIIIWATW